MRSCPQVQTPVPGTPCAVPALSPVPVPVPRWGGRPVLGWEQRSGAPRCQEFSKLELFIVFDNDTLHIPKSRVF